jgi:hypothetical protein
VSGIANKISEAIEEVAIERLVLELRSDLVGIAPRDRVVGRARVLWPE